MRRGKRANRWRTQKTIMLQYWKLIRYLSHVKSWTTGQASFQSSRICHAMVHRPHPFSPRRPLSKTTKYAIASSKWKTEREFNSLWPTVTIKRLPRKLAREWSSPAALSTTTGRQRSSTRTSRAVLISTFSWTKRADWTRTFYLATVIQALPISPACRRIIWRRRRNLPTARHQPRWLRSFRKSFRAIKSRWAIQITTIPTTNRLMMVSRDDLNSPGPGWPTLTGAWRQSRRRSTIAWIRVIRVLDLVGCERLF